MRGQPFDWIDRPENLLFTSGRLSAGISFTLSNATIRQLAAATVYLSPAQILGKTAKNLTMNVAPPSSIWGNALEATGKGEQAPMIGQPTAPSEILGNTGPLGVSPPPAPADDRTNGTSGI